MERKYQTFESYLGDIHGKNYHGLDDDMPDAFDAWVSELDVALVMEYAEDWGRKMYKRGQDFDINLGLSAEEEAQALDAIEHNQVPSKLSDEIK